MQFFLPCYRLTWKFILLFPLAIKTNFRFIKNGFVVDWLYFKFVYRVALRWRPYYSLLNTYLVCLALLHCAFLTVTHAWRMNELFPTSDVPPSDWFCKFMDWSDANFQRDHVLEIPLHLLYFKVRNGYWKCECFSMPWSIAFSNLLKPTLRTPIL